jgi:tRNA A37 threonylcarbamoyladenosine synthetase subunit TsaC/SUA5/YrdC
MHSGSTLVLKSTHIPDSITAGKDTVAVRCPIMI